jgi:excinuclease ABC subunit A
MSKSLPIKLVGAKENNLQNIRLSLYPGELTVITGLSGTGKSTLLFDVLHAEGQRRYVETFSPYLGNIWSPCHAPR